MSSGGGAALFPQNRAGGVSEAFHGVRQRTALSIEGAVNTLLI